MSKCRKAYWREYSRKRRATKEGKLKQLLTCGSAKRPDLDYETCLARLEAGGWKCEITGQPFVFDQPWHHYGLSIDQIIPGGGYTHDNIRFVCNWVNMAMHTWGLEALEEAIHQWKGV